MNTLTTTAHHCIVTVRNVVAHENGWLGEDGSATATCACGWTTTDRSGNANVSEDIVNVRAAGHARSIATR
jgi:hypothetical protein